jgi:hypothetical protein
MKSGPANKKFMDGAWQRQLALRQQEVDTSEARMLASIPEAYAATG